MMLHAVIDDVACRRLPMATFGAVENVFLRECLLSYERLFFKRRHRCHADAVAFFFYSFFFFSYIVTASFFRFHLS